MQPEALALVRKMLRWESVGDRLGDRVEEEEPGCGSAAGASVSDNSEPSQSTVGCFCDSIFVS